MIPARRIRPIEAVAEPQELTDEDIIESAASPVSGIVVRSTREPVAIPSCGSISDGVETNVSEVIYDLARLSDTTSIPLLREAIELGDLSPREGWLVSMITAGMPVQGILDISPLGEEETLGLLVKLINYRKITFFAQRD